MTIAPRLAERAAAAFSAAQNSYWVAVDISASAAPDTAAAVGEAQMVHLATVIEVAGRTPEEFDRHVDTLRQMRQLRDAGQRWLPSAQARVAAAADRVVVADAAVQRAAAELELAQRAAADAAAVSALERDRLDRGQQQLRGGDGQHESLRRAGCPDAILGDRNYPVPTVPPPPPVVRYRALQAMFVDATLRQPGEVFETCQLLSADAAEPVASDAVTDFSWPFRVLLPIVVSGRRHEQGDIVLLSATSWGAAGLSRLTAVEAAEWRAAHVEPAAPSGQHDEVAAAEVDQPCETDKPAGDEWNTTDQP